MEVACTDSWSCQMSCQSCDHHPVSPPPLICSHTSHGFFMWISLPGDGEGLSAPTQAGMIDDVSPALRPFVQGPRRRSGAPRWCPPTSAAAPTSSPDGQHGVRLWRKTGCDTCQGNWAVVVAGWGVGEVFIHKAGRGGGGRGGRGEIGGVTAADGSLVIFKATR